MPKISPASTEKLTSSTTVRWPYTLRRLLTSITDTTQSSPTTGTDLRGSPMLAARLASAERVEVGDVGLLSDDGQAGQVDRHVAGSTADDHARLPEVSQGPDGVGDRYSAICSSTRTSRSSNGPTPRSHRSASPAAISAPCG